MEIITLKNNIIQSICYKAVAPGSERIIDKELPKDWQVSIKGRHFDCLEIKILNM